jgi:hypothetical protein
LTARVAELAALIGARLAEDEATAKMAAREGGSWKQDDPLRYPGAISSLGGPVVYDEGSPDEHQAAHIIRNDPAYVLRRVKATRDLVAVILAERHDYNDGDEFYSCSQAVEYGTDGEPGSGCANDERAGRPCDCGRDARVARLLGIIASEWEGGTGG